MDDDGGGPARPEPAFRIDPVRIGRRNVAPIVAAVAVAAFVGAAIVKPWQAPPFPGVTDPGPSASATGFARATAAAPAPDPRTSSPSVPAFAEAMSPHDSWGIRAVVIDDTPSTDGGGPLTDQWQALAVPPATDDAGPTLGVSEGVGTTGRRVMAIEITTPRDSLALDVRFWRLDGAAGARRVLAIPTAGPEAGSWLWQPDPPNATPAGGWPDGDYRIDVLLAEHIVHVITRIRAESPPPPRPTPGGASSIPLLQALVTFPPGPFAFGPTSVQSVGVEEGPPLDQHEAWLGPATHLGADTRIGRIVGDPVVGVGVLLAPGQKLITTELDRVAPTTDMPTLRTVEIPGIAAYGSEAGPAVTLVPLAGMAFADGLYHLTVAILDTDGTTRTLSWTLEVAPSAPRILPADPLVQLPYLLTAVGPRRGADVPIVSDLDLGGGSGCGERTRIRRTDELLGLVVDPAADIRDLRLVPIDTIRRVDVPIRYAAGVVDGLSLIAVPHGGIAPRQYALMAAMGDGATQVERQYTICVG